MIFSCSAPKKVVDTSFSVIYNSAIGGAEKPGNIIISDNESYIQFIDSLKLDESQYANFLKVDFKRLTKRKCGKKLTQDTEKDFKEPFSSLVSSISVTFPFKWIFFSRVVRAAKWTRPLASSVAKRPLRKTS